MDRVHRIGQEKPVLVLRLAASHSIDGRILERANRKLALERMVIHRGAFKSVDEGKKNSLGAGGMVPSELVALMRDTNPLKTRTQSGVVTDAVCATTWSPTGRNILIVTGQHAAHLTDLDYLNGTLYSYGPLE